MATQTPKKPEDSLHGEEEKRPLFPANERPGGVYDDQASAESLSQIPTASQEGIDHLREQHRGGELSGSDLKDKEEGAESGTTAAIGTAEKGLMDKTGQLGKGYNPVDNALPPQAKIAKALSRVFTKKNTRNGGIVGGIIGLIIAGMFFLGSYELTAVRENLLGRVNKLPNSAMANRRVNTFAKSIKDGKLSKQLNQEKFVRKMTDRGFIVGFDPQTKKPNVLKFEMKDSKGNVVDTRSFKFDGDTKVATAEFFGNDALGKRAYREFQASTGWPAATWKGRQAQKVYAKYRISFSNWLDEPSTKGKTPKERFNEKFRKAQVETDARGDNSVQNPDDKDGDGKNDSDPEKSVREDTTPDLGVDDAGTRQQELLGDPASGKPDPERSRILQQLSDTRVSFSEALDGAKGSLGEDSAKKIAGSLNVFSGVSDACRVKGLLNFIQNTKNVILAYQVAKLAMLYNTAADHQKAGILSNQGLSLYMQYLKNKQPTGKSYTQAGGFRYMMGDESARPNKANAAKYNTGREDSGLLGDVRQFLNNGPAGALLNDTSCAVTSNGFVQAGGFIIGGVAAFLSGGTTTAASVAQRVLIGLASNVAFGIGEQILISSATGMVLNGWEGGEEAGDAMASGWGSMRGINASANGLRPITKARAVALSKQADQESREQLAQMPVFERYFSVYNDRSVTNRLAVASPGATGSVQPMNLLSSAMSSLSQTGLFAGVANLFGAKTGAADFECQDPQAKKLDLKTDAFCNIEVAEYNDNMNLDDTERILKANSDINSEGEPTSPAFEQYIKDCHSGRTGILYRNTDGIDPEKIKNGSVSPSQHSDVCVVNDPSEVSNGSYLDDVYKDGKQYEAGRFARYTNWFGYMTDQENLLDDFNDTRPTNGASDEESNSESGSVETVGDLKINKIKNPLKGSSCNCEIEPKSITLHWWAGGGEKGEGIKPLLNTFKGNGFSVQLGITSDGDVWQLTKSLTTQTNHAIGANDTSIGIEIAGDASHFGKSGIEKYPEKFEAVVKTVKYLVEKYDIPLGGRVECGNVSGIHPHKAYNSCAGASQKNDIDDYYFNEVMKRVRQ